MAADHFVSAQTKSFDCSSVRPGDTITLAAGEREPLAIRNCSGTSVSPIAIRNDSKGTGPVIIGRSEGSAGGFVFSCDNCVWTIIDGSGKWAGAPTAKTYGIKVTTSGGGSPSAFVKIAGLSRFVTIRNVEIDGRWPALATDGIGISVNDRSILAVEHPGLWREGILIEDNYIHNVEGEGMYIGPNWRDGGLPVRNAEIRRNIVEDTGWDGIQLKSAIQGQNRIHQNFVRRTGSRLDASAGQHHGISIYEGNGAIYGNWVEEAGESGINHFLHYMPESFGPQSCEIFNNVVIRPGQTGPGKGHGIVSSSQSGFAKPIPRIYNNTVVASKDSGVFVGSGASGGLVRDNIVADAIGQGIVVPGTATSLNNRIGAASQMGFVDATRKNYRLVSTSPARNAGSKEFPVEDFDKVRRPQDGSSDQGAFEYSDSSASPPEPPVLVEVG